jgi:hypothetical protein
MLRVIGFMLIFMENMVIYDNKKRKKIKEEEMIQVLAVYEV